MRLPFDYAKKYSTSTFACWLFLMMGFQSVFLLNDVNAVSSDDQTVAFDRDETCILDDSELDPPAYCFSEVAVELTACDDQFADLIANKYGFINHGQIGSLKCHYSFTYKHGGRRRRESQSSLDSDPDVRWSQGQRAKRRVKRDFKDEEKLERKRSSKTQLTLPWRDPLYNDQWFLHNGASGGWDMKVKEAWRLGYSGVGVSVSILDDGIQWNHPDLRKNYDKLASADINSKDDDPMPKDNGDNKHGTRCAGEVAAEAGNNWCGVGVAYNAGIGGVRMLDGPVSDRVEAASLSLRQDHIDIYSASWGPEDDGRTFDGPGPLAKKAFIKGIKEGRNGKGNIFIWASGNGGAHRDSCSCDGYTTSIYTLSVSSATFDNRKPWYLEECPSTIATTYSSASAMQPAIVTVDMPNGCTKSHTGTSASAPMAAGIVSLALEANRNLTWRDMQHIVLRSANPTPLLSNPGWITNGVGRKVSSKFGYGIMDAEALVKLARSWNHVAGQHSCTVEYKMGNPNPRPLKGRFRLQFSMEVTGCPRGQEVNYLEQVQAVITVKFSKRGDLKISMVAPSGTRSELLPARPNDMNRNGFHKWPFLSVQQWGEDPRGVWNLTIENVGSDRNSGSFHDWSLIVYGTKDPAQSGDPSHGANVISPLPPASSRFPPTSDVRGDQVVNVRESGLFSASGGGLAGMQTGISSTVGPCHPECEGGCSEKNSAIACNRCRHYKLLLSNRGGTKCVERCWDGQYADEVEKRCKQCLRGCATCKDGDNCVTCQDGYFLILADQSHLHHKQCLHECPPGFLPDKTDPLHPACKIACSEDCLTCKSDSVCRYCRKGFFLTDEGSCLHRCPTGTYPNREERRCNHCPALCEFCSTALRCERCEIGTEWKEQHKVCLHRNSKVCVSRPCQEGTFCDSTVDQCLECHPSCSSCNGPKEDNCLKCATSGELVNPKNNRCSQCDYYSFYNETIRKCVDCDDACAGCRGQGPSRCISCATGYQNVGGHCLRCCAEGESPIGHPCVPCDASVSRPLGGVRKSHLIAIVIALCLGAVLLFVFVFACLMCKDNDGSFWTNKNGTSNIPYKKVPVTYSLNEDGPLVKELDNGDSGIRSSESENEDLEDTLFDTRLTIER